eukprot:CAMPEP_0201880896 /NCGR_PEP_ID=MMETSP0902-20130614/11371_1 /ASSEMBLY_ACC=CAM_ASM_000551 /TAXON_ID=420261 /ORGANISM="Thalassiosira antarctica, Strain CCMP982" /LENGTH=610 /DNA_ID=CAMNT_0048408997 /DNA_START=50 /DNA_END=1882 /DNA_ORIENTATION=+
MDDVEEDNERHRREEQERRAKRQKNRDTKSKSSGQSEKERKRREHAQRILGAQKKKQSLPHSSSSAPSQSQPDGGSSVFQSLFHERAEGFFIDLRFRNAPPRPPVGPAFVGLGLEGELTNKWTKYKARNAVENQYTWKIHPERDLGVPLAVSAMDYEGCYTDPAKKDKKGEDGIENNKSPLPHVSVALHPDDEALINWKGATGDTAAEQLQQKQDRVRAAARLAIAQGHGAMPFKTPSIAHSSNSNGGANSNSGSAVRLKRHHLKSRILDEELPHFMKKTTYLTNDAKSVHQFTSLAHTKQLKCEDVDRALAETKTKYSEMDMIERGFKEANVLEILCVGSENVKTNTAAKKKRRINSSKKDVYPLWDLPLLPDVPTWGHTFTHVVVDNPPKNISSNATKTDKKQGSEIFFKAKQLNKAIVADVTKQTQNAKMACTMWAPKSQDSIHAVSESESSESPTKKSKKGEMYRAVQQYDLDVVPLRDSSAPPDHYVWIIDPSKKYAGYHNVGSRVQLSTGRPIVVSGTPRGANTAEMATDKSYVLHMTMKEEEKKNLEMKMAEVDMDLAEKYGMMEEGGLEGGGTHGKGRGGRKTQSLESESSSDDDEIEADAF